MSIGSAKLVSRAAADSTPLAAIVASELGRPSSASGRSARHASGTTCRAPVARAREAASLTGHATSSDRTPREKCVELYSSRQAAIRGDGRGWSSSATHGLMCARERAGRRCGRRGWASRARHATHRPTRNIAGALCSTNRTTHRRHARIAQRARAAPRRAHPPAPRAAGIGLAAAIMMAREGAHVAFTHHPRERVDADAARERIGAEGGRVLAVPVDFAVGGEAACKGVVDAVVEEWGHVDCLVNNAAVQCVDAHCPTIQTCFRPFPTLSKSPARSPTTTSGTSTRGSRTSRPSTSRRRSAVSAL